MISPAGSPVAVLTSNTIDSHFASTDDSGNTQFGIGDALGSTTGLTSGTGTLNSTLKYEPYGQTTGSVQAAYPFAYTGRVPLVGNIYYFRNRHYDSVAGRFLSEDPLGLNAGSNFYAYVGANPLYGIDPFGLREGNDPTQQPGFDPGAVGGQENANLITGLDGWHQAEPRNQLRAGSATCAVSASGEFHEGIAILREAFAAFREGFALPAFLQGSVGFFKVKSSGKDIYENVPIIVDPTTAPALNDQSSKSPH